MDEGLEVKLARMEEVQKASHDKLDRIERAITPVAARVEKHHIELTILKRDRKWVFLIVTVIGSISGSIMSFLKAMK